MDKIFLVSYAGKTKDLYDIADMLISNDNSLDVARKFTSDPTYKDIMHKMYKYADTANIELDYKNNSLLCVNTNLDNISTGYTLDDYYNKDIFCLSIQEFNNLPAWVFSNMNVTDNILVVWVDYQYHSENVTSADVSEAKMMMRRLDETPYLYFLNTDPESAIDIFDTITEYLYTDEVRRDEILYENN